MRYIYLLFHKHLYWNYLTTLIPLLPFTATWRFHVHLGLLYFVPICTESRPSTLRVTFHHSSFSIVVGVTENLLEERVKGTVSTHVRILICGLLLFCT